MDAKKCPYCGAPLSYDGSNNNTIVCSYCGNEIRMTSGLKENPSRDIKAYINPKYDDEGCKKRIVEYLVLTDFVPYNIFKGFKLINIFREFYPIYVYNVNWSANWSATFTQQVSHEEPTYDYKGNVTGKRIVYETHYRDVNGVSASNCQVILSGIEKMPQSNEVIDFLSKQEMPNQESYANFDNSEYKNWKEIEPQMTNDEVWKNQIQTAEQQMKCNVSNTVLVDVKEKAGERWDVQSHNYVYNYNSWTGRCILIPLWTAEIKCNDTYLVTTIEATSGVAFFHNSIPLNEKEIEKKEISDKKVNSAREKRNLCYWLFAASAHLAVFFSIELFATHELEELPLFFVFITMSGISFFLARFYQQKNKNSKYESVQMLYESKKQRKQEAKKEFGYDVNIGEAPPKKKISRVVDAVVYLVMLVLLICSIVLSVH